MNREEVLEKTDLSIVPYEYGLMGMFFLNELVENQELVKVYTKDKRIHKKVYIRADILDRVGYRYHQFKYKFYNPYSKKSYFENRDSVVKLESSINTKDLVKKIKKKYINRAFNTLDPNRYSSVEEAKEALIRIVDNQKMREEGDIIMSTGYKKFMDSDVLGYLVENKVPVKFYYITGEEEILCLKMYDTYNYLAKNDEKGTTNLIHKSNVVKMEIMGDIEKIFVD
ncbi:hypothetical protein SAMN06265827_1507 [Orenia metallireducens]|jgi:hypothetical protein|uniref:Uncharacterized protein n=1 Tax=Orenia metallireducens TaxID=1413210 RepID=A0A285IHC3_9FIRM|nr:hypothetical protein [Orenia metallireducens]SNY47385.1 hypothetical protein SAMN06265827_1507 [Orenia metallireducens]